MGWRNKTTYPKPLEGLILLGNAALNHVSSFGEWEEVGSLNQRKSAGTR